MRSTRFGTPSAEAVGRAHHRNFDALIAQSSDTSRPCSFDRVPAFELKAELAKKINRGCKVIDNNSYVVHSFKRRVSNLQTVSSVLTTELGLIAEKPQDRRFAAAPTITTAPAIVTSGSPEPFGINV